MTTSTEGNFEVVTGSTANLDALAESIREQKSIIDSHADAFKEAVLPRMLTIGLRCMQAQELFGAEIPNPTGKNQHSKEVVSRRDTTSPASFAEWIETADLGIKRTAAIKYVQAVKGLGLSTASTPEDVTREVTKLRKAGDKPSLAKLMHKACTGDAPPALQLPPDTQQTRTEDAREAVHQWEQDWHAIVRTGALEDLHLPDLKNLKEFLQGTLDQINAAIK